MASWTKNQSGEWVVFAAVEEIYDMSAIVTKKNGETLVVHFNKISKPFKGKFGTYAGKECVYATPVKEFHSDRKIPESSDIVDWFGEVE